MDRLASVGRDSEHKVERLQGRSFDMAFQVSHLKIGTLSKYFGR